MPLWWSISINRIKINLTALHIVFINLYISLIARSDDFASVPEAK